MKTFLCHCGNRLYFENSRCLTCGRTLGFLPEYGRLCALSPAGKGDFTPLAPNLPVRPYRMCANYRLKSVCNWMVAAEDDSVYCRSCRLNELIPDLGKPGNLKRWYRVEMAKRRLLYTLFSLGLPLTDRGTDPEGGLAFRFMESAKMGPEFADPVDESGRILTGHLEGIITLNLEEADPGAREEMREKMNEGYRTLLGHFRHESGHYYWDRLVQGGHWLSAFRDLFGDERADYGTALSRHYRQGPPGDWQERHLSAYASVHPWEDWAETWAHYLHMADTLETAADLGLVMNGMTVRPLLPKSEGNGSRSFGDFLAAWGHLIRAMNDLNRSMGLPDAYPFPTSTVTERKLRFIDDVVSAAAIPIQTWAGV